LHVVECKWTGASKHSACGCHDDGHAEGLHNSDSDDDNCLDNNLDNGLDNHLDNGLNNGLDNNLDNRPDTSLDSNDDSCFDNGLDNDGRDYNGLDISPDSGLCNSDTGLKDSLGNISNEGLGNSSDNGFDNIISASNSLDDDSADSRETELRNLWLHRLQQCECMSMQ